VTDHTDHKETPATEPRSRQDALGELQARVEAALDEVRPKIRRALEELDARLDAAVAEVKPRAQSAMQEVQPRIDQFVTDVQPRLDALLVKLQSRIDDLRRDLEDRAHRTHTSDVPAGELPPAGGTTVTQPGASGEANRDTGVGL
jgi:hypothetical protein